MRPGGVWCVNNSLAGVNLIRRCYACEINFLETDHMKSTKFIKSLGCAGLVFTSAGLLAAPSHTKYEGIQATEIPFIAAGKTILDQTYAYPTGAPRIQSYMVTIAPNKPTDVHAHAIPVLVYLVSGQMEVDYGSKGKRTIKAGESYVEAINWCHQGRAAGGKGVTVMVTYLGQENADTIKPTTCAKLD